MRGRSLPSVRRAPRPLIEGVPVLGSLAQVAEVVRLSAAMPLP